MIDNSGKASRLCVGCVSLVIESAIRGYGEYTPGDAAEISCLRGHWTGILDVEDFAENMQLAGKCGDFQLAPDLAARLPVNESDYPEDDV